MSLQSDDSAGRDTIFITKIKSALLVAAKAEIESAGFESASTKPRRRAVVRAIFRDIDLVAEAAARTIAANSSVDASSTDNAIQTAVNLSLAIIDWAYWDEADLA